MNKSLINEVALVLLNGTLSQPKWKKVPRRVKHKLMNILGAKHYTNIHDPRLYEDLEKAWTMNNETKELHNADKVKESLKVECSVCMDTYDIDGKVTTLLCGHKFCTRCVMNHLEAQQYYASCPLCRASVFVTPEPVILDTGNISHQQEQQEQLEKKRQRRRQERMRKRKRKREHKIREGGKM